MITYGPSTDGQFRIARGSTVVAKVTSFDRAKATAEHLAASEGVTATRVYFTISGTPPREPGRVVEVVLDEDGRMPKPGRMLVANFGAPLVAKADPAPAPDIRDLSIGQLREALATGKHDDHLDALEAAEKAGADRKGALKAISERREG